MHAPGAFLRLRARMLGITCVYLPPRHHVYYQQGTNGASQIGLNGSTLSGATSAHSAQNEASQRGSTNGSRSGALGRECPTGAPCRKTKCPPTAGRPVWKKPSARSVPAHRRAPRVEKTKCPPTDGHPDWKKLWYERTARCAKSPEYP